MYSYIIILGVATAANTGLDTMEYVLIGIGGAILLGILILVMCIICVCCVRYRRRPKIYSPSKGLVKYTHHTHSSYNTHNMHAQHTQTTLTHTHTRTHARTMHANMHTHTHTHTHTHYGIITSSFVIKSTNSTSSNVHVITTS